MRHSLYDRLGGATAVNGAAEVLYRRLLADDRINAFFAGVDVETLMRKQKRFLTYAFGGMSHFPGRPLRDSHASLVERGLGHRHFTVLVEHLDATLDELGVERRLTSEVIDIVNRTRVEVLGRPVVESDAHNTPDHPEPQGTSPMRRIAFFTYGVISYAIFFAVFCYACGFVGNLFVPKGMDSAPTMGFGAAILVNLCLLTVFALQHSVMARPSFKRVWTQVIPEPLERSTYTLFSSLAMILLFALWQPVGGTIWTVSNPIGAGILWGGFAFGWLLVLVSTFQINHFDLFGLRQVWLYLLGRPYTPLQFRTPFLYRFVRHPLYVGWFFAFWATPTMTATHLLFALVTSAYILVAIQLEERNLADALPEYKEYRKGVPMLIPFTKGRPAGMPPVVAPETVPATSH